mmetsp:Transcript_29378/g.68793  ORF Transcript_29378/g.68793 Transcript_29378/m.68793 type:complete len:310 (-) Transcript_29378:126-1055(-)
MLQNERATCTHHGDLSVLPFEGFSHPLEQVSVVQVLVLLQTSDQSVGHRTGSLTTNHCVGRCLLILTTRKLDDIGFGSTGLLRLLSGCRITAFSRFHQQFHTLSDTCHCLLLIAIRQEASTCTNKLGDALILTCLNNFKITIDVIHVRQVQDALAMTAIHNGGKANSLGQSTGQHVVYLVINNLPRTGIIHRAEGLVKSILLITICISHRATVSRVMENQRVASLGASPEPLEPSNDVGPRGLLAWILLVIREDQYLIDAKVAGEELLDILHIIDAPTQFSLLSEIIDTDEQSLPLSSYRTKSLSGLLC